jgi:hypothetical protein
MVAMQTMVFIRARYNMRVNVFRQPSMEPFVTHMRLLYEDNMKKDTESYWRNKISKEILWACEHDIDPCYECKELSLFIKNGMRNSS